jgi:hypothetical protein
MLVGFTFALTRLYYIQCTTTLEEQLLNIIVSLGVAYLSFTYIDTMGSILYNLSIFPENDISVAGPCYWRAIHFGTISL